jgi:hypothetical protein
MMIFIVTTFPSLTPSFQCQQPRAISLRRFSHAYPPLDFFYNSYILPKATPNTLYSFKVKYSPFLRQEVNW